MERKMETMSYQEPLLTPADVMEILGISRANATRLMRGYGIRLGRRYYITKEQLQDALNALAGQSHPEGRRTGTVDGGMVSDACAG